MRRSLSRALLLNYPNCKRADTTSVPSLEPLMTTTQQTLNAKHRKILKNWWSQSGSNRRPLACKASALPAELWPLNRISRKQSRATSRQFVCLVTLKVVGLGGLEPPTSPLSGVCSSHLSYRPDRTYAVGSNRFGSSNLCER